jgi:hypothetical protein
VFQFTPSHSEIGYQRSTVSTHGDSVDLLPDGSRYVFAPQSSELDEDEFEEYAELLQRQFE